MVVKHASAPSGGGSARGAVRYILGYALGDKSEPEREAYHALIAESMTREDGGTGVVWSPASGGGKRPSSILAVGVGSMATAAVEMEAVARANARVKTPVHHLIYSFSEAESARLTDEQILGYAREHIERIGMGDHQAVLAVHRDTVEFEHHADGTKTTVPGSGNVHIHASVASVNPYTLKAWETSRNFFRISEAARKVELANGLEHDRGLFVVDELTGDVRRAKTAERSAWRTAGAEHRLERATRMAVGDYAEFESDESWAERVGTRIGKRLREAQDRGESFSASDVHFVAAGHGARVRSVEGRLEVTLLEKVREGPTRKTSAIGEQDAHRDAKPEHVSEYRARATVLVDIRDVAGHPTPPPTESQTGERTRGRRKFATTPTAAVTAAKKYAAKEETARDERESFLIELEDVEQSELSYAESVRRDPSIVSRTIVARGSATFDTDDIFRELSGRISDVDVIEELRDRIESEDDSLVMLTADTEQPLYTTRAQLALEQRVADKIAYLASQRDETYRPDLMEQAISDVEATKTAEWRSGGKAGEFRLSDEQREVARAIEYRGGWVQGDAGTGKTTAMQVVARYGELTGRDVLGQSTSEAASVKLAKEAGIVAMNTARADALENIGEEVTTARSITIQDEASMASLAHLDRSLDRIIERGGTFIAIGDTAQLQAIDAGATQRIGLAVAQQHGRAFALTEVRRQRDQLEWMRPVVSDMGAAITSRDADAAQKQIDVMAAHDVFQFEEDRNAMLGAATADYVQRMKKGETPLMVAGSNLTSGHANRLVRAQLGIADGMRVKTESFGKLDFAPGDRIAFLRNSKRLGVVNGNVGIVVAAEKHSMTVTLENGESVTFDPAKYKSITHGYCLTIAKSQGQDQRAAIVIGDRGLSAEMLHVAVTRATHEVRAYMDGKTYADASAIGEQVAQRMGTKDSALDFRRIVEQTGGPKTAWAQRMRAAMADEADPCRREHWDDNRAREAAAQLRSAEISAKYRELSRYATSAESKRLARDQARETATVLKDLGPRSFAEWGLANRTRIEQQIAAREVIACPSQQRVDVERRGNDLEVRIREAGRAARERGRGLER